MARFTPQDNAKYFNLQITDEFQGYNPLDRLQIIPIKVRVPDTVNVAMMPRPPISKSVGYTIDIDNSLTYRPLIRSSLKSLNNNIVDQTQQRMDLKNDEVFLNMRPLHDRRDYETVKVSK